MVDVALVVVSAEMLVGQVKGMEVTTTMLTGVVFIWLFAMLLISVPGEESLDVTLLLVIGAWKYEESLRGQLKRFPDRQYTKLW